MRKEGARHGCPGNRMFVGFQKWPKPFEPMQDHVDALLSFVDSNADSLLSLKDKCSFDCFCGFSSGAGQGGFGMSFSRLSRMGQLKIGLILELYSAHR